MIFFEDTEDLREWLEQLDYDAFWEAIEPFGLFDDGARDSNARNIAKGRVTRESSLRTLKFLARVFLTRDLGLKPRIYEPLAVQALKSTH
ncbi:hypothetical protein [uncultured Hoeflea sp.]|uniref:hypothetical protein n=1 Tax=uncultured Hoeflea sp. TaxID=538666 RepID=UPI0026090ECB|nr:hypothetical protein [uncultured Hoeflea sp.]